MGVRDLTATDLLRFVTIRHYVRLQGDEKDRWTSAAIALVTGGTANREDLLAPLERTRERIAKEYGQAYADDLLARLRR